ncbi:MAG TPA: NUDIX hydrolase [Gemmatimonadaceae bacterium]|jgi:ADP-ribose pyrophosphatase|nr:NUDIX hydrolase [Gemmatimonadaceae bacterium]
MSDDALIKSTRIHTGRVINLDVDQVRFPDGTTGELEIIRHPGASAIVPFLTDPAGPNPQVLLIKQYRYATGGTLYEIPAGRLDPGEQPEACARRELLEETGCTAESIVPLTSMYTTPGFTDERIHLFLATGLTRGETRREADEFIEIETVTMSDALQMVQRGEIQDAKTALGLLFAAGFSAGL